MAKNAKVIHSETVQNQFVEMFMSGMKMTDIAIALKVDRSTVYEWKDRDDIKAKLDRCRCELENTGKNFVKSRYLQYLENVDKLCNQTEDKRVALSANVFLLEKLDGKATNRIDLANVTDSKVVSKEELELEFNKYKQIEEDILDVEAIEG